MTPMIRPPDYNKHSRPSKWTAVGLVLVVVVATVLVLVVLTYINDLLLVGDRVDGAR